MTCRKADIRKSRMPQCILLSPEHFDRSRAYKLQQSPSLSAKAPELYLASAVAFPGTEDGGKVSLRSTDPKDHPLIDPNFLSSPFDRRLAIEAVRETVELLDTPLVAEGRIRWAAGPSGMGDEEILVRHRLKLKKSNHRTDCRDY